MAILRQKACHTKHCIFGLEDAVVCGKYRDPGSKYSDLIGTMCAFSCRYVGHYFSDRAEICQ